MCQIIETPYAFTNFSVLIYNPTYIYRYYFIFYVNTIKNHTSTNTLVLDGKSVYTNVYIAFLIQSTILNSYCSNIRIPPNFCSICTAARIEWSK